MGDSSVYIDRGKQMSDGTKNIFKLIGVLIAVFLGYKIVMWALHLAISIFIPIAIIGAIGYGVYRFSGGKALMGGRKTLP